MKLILSFSFILFQLGLAQGQASENPSPLAGYSLKKMYQQKDVPLPQSTSPSQMSVFWWNTGCSSKNNKSADAKAEQQWSNLKRLAEDPNFEADLIILGEFCGPAFKKTRDHFLKKHFPHTAHIEKINNSFKIKNGIRVYSKLPIEDFKNESLESYFEESKMQSACSDEYKKKNPKSFKTDFWKRKFLSFKVTKDEKSFPFYVFHLANPWKILNACLSKKSFAYEILFGNTNINYRQSEEIIDLLKATAPDSSFITLGDFNAPSDLPFIRASNSYKLLRDHLGKSLVEGSPIRSYIDPSKRFPYVTIDHVFTSEDFFSSYAEVLPFAGSDHLPLYFQIQYKQPTGLTDRN